MPTGYGIELAADDDCAATELLEDTLDETSDGEDAAMEVLENTSEETSEDEGSEDDDDDDTTVSVVCGRGRVCVSFADVVSLVLVCSGGAVYNGTLIEVVKGIVRIDGSVGELDCTGDVAELGLTVEVAVSASVYVKVYVCSSALGRLFRDRVIVVVTTVLSVIGSRPSARKLDSISSSVGVLFVDVLGRLVRVDGRSSVIGIGVSKVNGSAGSVRCRVVVVCVPVSVSRRSLEVLSSAEAVLL